MTFEQAARDHIASRGAPETRTIYLGDLTRWLAFCQLENVSPDEPPFSAAVKFRDIVVAKYAGTSARRVLSALSSMYEAAGLVNHFRSSRRLPRPGADEVTVTKSFSEEEARIILEHARTADARDYAVFRLLYDTGLRISEVLNAKRAQLTQESTGLVLVGTVKKKGRVKTELTEESSDAVARWLAVAPRSPFVFPATRGPGHITNKAITGRLQAYARSAGLFEPERFHPHRFRATYITTALDAGVPLHEVQAAVHHSDPKTTLRYDRGVRGTGVANAVAAFRKKR